MTGASVFVSLLSIAYVVIIISTILIIITENSNPSKTIAWLIVLMVFPAIGLIFYYIFGYNARRSVKPEEDFLAFYEKFLTLLSGDTAERLQKASHQERIPIDFSRLSCVLERSNYSQVLYGSQVEIITEGKRKFDSLIEDLENARHHIHIEYFYFRRDETGRKIRDILMRKAEEGVKVRFIYENIANIDISPRYYHKMKESGVEVVAFTKASLPWVRRNLNYRDHRKVVVIDGYIGYTGGMNIGDDYSIKWRDTHLRIVGEGVYGLQTNFLHIWFNSGGIMPECLDRYYPETEHFSENLLQIVPEAPNSRWPYLLYAFVNAVENAKRYIYIQTPYYMPPDSLLQSLKSAALSGVDVRIMVSQKSDIFFMDPATQSYYEESLQAGIRIYEHTDIFSHAKSMVVDDYLSIIGSANMDFRSLELSFEINTYMYDIELAKQNYDIFFKDMEGCREVLLENWIKRPWWKKLFQSIMRLFSPLL